MAPCGFKNGLSSLPFNVMLGCKTVGLMLSGFKCCGAHAQVIPVPSVLFFQTDLWSSKELPSELSVHRGLQDFSGQVSLSVYCLYPASVLREWLVISAEKALSQTVVNTLQCQ